MYMSNFSGEVKSRMHLCTLSLTQKRVNEQDFTALVSELKELSHMAGSHVLVVLELKPDKKSKQLNTFASVFIVPLLLPTDISAVS
jgi:hypothetical protein